MIKLAGSERRIFNFIFALLRRLLTLSSVVWLGRICEHILNVYRAPDISNFHISSILINVDRENMIIKK